MESFHFRQGLRILTGKKVHSQIHVMPYIDGLTLYYELNLLTFNDWFTSLGLTQVKVCVNKDGHHFYTHISEKKKEDKLKDFDIFSTQGMCCKTISIACIKCKKNKKYSGTSHTFYIYIYKKEHS